MYIPMIFPKQPYIPVSNRFCERCGAQIFHSDVKGYPYVCLNCDENKFTFETYIEKTILVRRKEANYGK